MLTNVYLFHLLSGTLPREYATHIEIILKIFLFKCEADLLYNHNGIQITKTTHKLRKIQSFNYVS